MGHACLSTPYVYEKGHIGHWKLILILLNILVYLILRFIFEIRWYPIDKGWHEVFFFMCWLNYIAISSFVIIKRCIWIVMQHKNSENGHNEVLHHK